MSENYESLPENVPFSNHLLAGAFAGIAEHGIIYPIDSIKTRIQASTNANKAVLNIFQKSASLEAIRSLWKGISAVVVGAGPAHAVYFATYESMKNRLVDSHGLTPEIDSYGYYSGIAASGAIATAASEALMNPFDTIKQRMQVNSSFIRSSKQYTPQYSSVSSTAKLIARKEGLAAFYYSYPTTLFMTVPFHMTNFLIYESVTKLLNPDNKYNPSVHCVAGGLAGGFASAITTPFDCIKTVLQTHSYTRRLEDAPIAISSSSSGSASITKASVYNNTYEGSQLLQLASRNIHQSSAVGTKVNSFLSAARYIYLSHGIMGFCRGMKARVAANVPATAISWTSYEMAKYYLNENS